MNKTNGTPQIFAKDVIWNIESLRNNSLTKLNLTPEILYMKCKGKWNDKYQEKS